jgi:hypothetical protein
MEYVKERLLALKGVIPEILHIELGFNIKQERYGVRHGAFNGI